MRISVIDLRRLIVEQLTVDRLTALYAPAVEKFAAWLRQNPNVLETQAGIEALGAHFYWIKPGSVPTDADVQREIRNFVKRIQKIYDSEEDRLELLQRHIDGWDPATGDCIKRLEAIAKRSRPKDVPPEGKTWGSYLFAPARDDVPIEKNTSDEQKAYSAIHSMLFRNKALPTKVANQIQALVANGEYLELLDPHYEDFYRGMNNVSTEDLTKLLGHAPTTDRGRERVATSFEPRQEGSSWSAERKRAVAYARHGSSGVSRSKSNTWSVVVHARKSDNPNKFILNPDVLYDIGDFAGNDDQDNSDDLEVYAVGSIVLADVTFVKGKS